MEATVCKKFDFPAAHHNEHHDGHCQRVHGHTWVLEIQCRGPLNQDKSSPSYGMVIDFSEIKAAYAEYIEPFVEHQDLNETLDIPESTTEHIAAWIFGRLRRVLPNLYKVRLWEGMTSYAEICNGYTLK